MISVPDEIILQNISAMHLDITFWRNFNCMTNPNPATLEAYTLILIKLEIVSEEIYRALLNFFQ